ncbi:MAG: hypothetical protein ACKOCG_03620 [Candidatus Nanopelagicus sp.]
MLTIDRSDVVRREVAENSNTPVEVLTKLATDKDGVVRVCVACNLNALTSN